MTTVAVEHESAPAAHAAPYLTRRSTLAALAAGGLLAAVGGGLLLATSDHLVDPVAYGIQIAVMVVGTVGAALYWLVRRPGSRLGLALLALAVATIIIALQGASQPLLHSIAVLVEPALFLLAYYVVFAFPDGRAGRVEKLLLGALTLYFLVGFVPYMFFSPVVSGGAPLAGCNEACPTNALMIADRPTIAASFGSDLSYVVIAIASAILVCLLYRLVTATRPRRRALLPVYVPALMLTVPILIFHGVVTQLLNVDASTISKAGWSVTIGRSLLPYAFLLAIVLTAFFAAGALKAIVDRLGDNTSTSQLRTILAHALDDPSLDLAFRVDGARFVDSSGELVALEPAAERSATPVVRNGETVAVITHDPALNTDPELVRAAGQALLLALEKGRLETELGSTTAELRASRARIVAAGDAERRRIERDLHDGAQQHLVALRIRIGLAGELAAKDPQVAERLADVGADLEEILRELRSLAHGLHPPVLRQFGLREALASVSRRSTPPAKLEAAAIGRYAEEIETAVYFCCLEALQNVGKHAGADSRAVIRLWQRGNDLCFEIGDDGAGYDVDSTPVTGTGLTNMADRLAALGGTFAVDSTPGQGTRVRASLPVAESGLR